MMAALLLGGLPMDGRLKSRGTVRTRLEELLGPDPREALQRRTGAPPDPLVWLGAAAASANIDGDNAFVWITPPDEVPHPLRDWLTVRGWQAFDGQSEPLVSGVLAGYEDASLEQQVATLRAAMARTGLPPDAADELLHEAETTGQGTVQLADGRVTVYTTEGFVLVETGSPAFLRDCELVWDPPEMPSAATEHAPLLLREMAADDGPLADAVLDALSDLAYEASKYLPVLLPDATEAPAQAELDFGYLQGWWQYQWPEDAWEDATGAVAAEMWIPVPLQPGRLPRHIREDDEQKWWRDVLRPAATELVEKMKDRRFEEAAEVLLRICDHAEAAGAFHVALEPVAVGPELAAVAVDVAARLAPAEAAALEVRAVVLRAVPAGQRPIALEREPDRSGYERQIDRRGRVRYHLTENDPPYVWYADAHDLPDDVIVVKGRTISSNPATGRRHIETFDSDDDLIDELEQLPSGPYRILQR